MAKQFINGYFQRGGDGLTAYWLYNGQIEVKYRYSCWQEFIRVAGDVTKRYSDSLYEPFRNEYGTACYMSCVYWDCDGSLYPVSEMVGDIRQHYPTVYKLYRGKYPYWLKTEPWGFKRHKRYVKGAYWLRPNMHNERKAMAAEEADSDMNVVFEEDWNDIYNQVDPNKLKHRPQRKKAFTEVWYDECNGEREWKHQKNWKKYRKTQWK